MILLFTEGFWYRVIIIGFITLIVVVWSVSNAWADREKYRQKEYWESEKAFWGK